MAVRPPPFNPPHPLSCLTFTLSRPLPRTAPAYLPSFHNPLPLTHPPPPVRPVPPLTCTLVLVCSPTASTTW